MKSAEFLLSLMFFLFFFLLTYFESYIHRHKKETKRRKMFTKIPQKSQKNTYARVLFFIKLQAVAGLRPGTLLKKRLWSEPAIKEKVF